MFSLFFKNQEPDKAKEISALYKKLKEIYKYEEISEEKKQFLTEEIEKYGYLRSPHIKALEELTPAETLFGLEIKWKQNGIFENNHFKFHNNQISPVVRAGITNSDWIKKEQHSIKLINLAALGDGNTTHEVGKFIDWLKQILILPAGNLEKNVLATTAYLIPFHPREFGCAYLPSSASVSPNLEDKLVNEATGLNAKEQVKLFIKLAQLAGHPVIYDVLPQTGRYSKVVLSRPHVARWFDVYALMKQIEEEVDKIGEKLIEEFDSEDIELTKKIYKKTLYCGSNDLSDYYKVIYDRIEKELEDKKRVLSEKMATKAEQIKLQKRAKEIVASVHNTNPSKISREKHITKQGQAIQTLIKEGLWTAPGGAWCSSGIPVFDRMSECGSFPVFKHFDYEGNDVSHFANLDCQTPYYYFYLDTKEYNNAAIETLMKRSKDRQLEYNFDGTRVDHIDHVVDEFSEKDGLPISYRIPKQILAKSNKMLKEITPHYASMAEYMLGGHYYDEYHKEMKFDILWGDDIISQSTKTPYEIIKNNQDLQDYNAEDVKYPHLSILKTYNNQDGEFRDIDQYPGQLGEAGAIFKWFKLKFLPGGKLAQRPVLYVDGDESFTKAGIESTVISEISLSREKNYDFFYKFDAINRFALNNELTREGEAQIISENEDGFCSWMISKDPLKETLLVVANYYAPTEKITTEQEDGTKLHTIKEGEPIYERSIEVPGDYKIIAEIKYDEEQKDFVEIPIEKENNTLSFEKLDPSEFKIYKLLR